MKTEVIQTPELDESQFPGLFLAHHNHAVVLMTKPGSGCVVGGESDLYSLGYYSDGWVMGQVTRLPSNSRVVITQE